MQNYGKMLLISSLRYETCSAAFSTTSLYPTRRPWVIQDLSLSIHCIHDKTTIMMDSILAYLFFICFNHLFSRYCLILKSPNYHLTMLFPSCARRVVSKSFNMESDRLLLLLLKGPDHFHVEKSRKISNSLADDVQHTRHLCIHLHLHNRQPPVP